MNTTEFRIGTRRVGDVQPAYFIADISANHDGDLQRARALIHLAAEAGADAAKFQNFRAAQIVSDYGFKTLGAQQSHQAKWKNTWRSRRSAVLNMAAARAGSVCRRPSSTA